MELLYDNTNLSIILFTRDRFALLTLQTDNNNDLLIRHIEIFSNVSLVKTDYFIFDKASSSFIILSISLINSRLDISNLLSKKKKLCRESAGVIIYGPNYHDPLSVSRKPYLMKADRIYRYKKM